MRETAVVRVPAFPGTRNRDQNKIFKITEWPAAHAERWALRMLLATNKGGGELPLDLAGMGMEGIAIIGINTFLRGNISDDAILPLIDELLECVEVIRDVKHPEVVTKLVDGDIEEPATRMWLRGEVLSLHLNFSVAAVLSALYARIMMPKPSPDLSPPRTSRRGSRRSSGAASQPSPSSNPSTPSETSTTS
jgi:hypothetical protein